jgi:hypothetical protein
MGIDVTVTDQNVQVSTSGQTVNASVSGGVGPAGPAGQGVPVGGTTGQVLAKASGTNYDTTWTTPTGGGGGGGAATAVVGRSNAEFVCTGTAGSATDHVTIQAAIAAVQAAGGGTVLIREGTYYLGATINITAPNVAVIGFGRATELRAMTDYGNVFSCALPTTPTEFPGLAGLRFERLRFETAVNRTTGAAIYAAYTHDAQLHDLYIADATYGSSQGLGTPPPHFWDGIRLVAQDQCDISNVTAHCRNRSIYLDGSGYASADFSYDGTIRYCNLWGVFEQDENFNPIQSGTGVYVGNNIGGVLVEHLSANQLEYAVEAVMTSPYTQGGGIITIRGGYTENNTTHGYRVVNYQNAAVTELWGGLLLSNVLNAYVTSTGQATVRAINGGAVHVYGRGTQLDIASGTTCFAYGTAFTIDPAATGSPVIINGEWTASTITQAEAEAGTSTTRRAFTAQRVFQAVAAWWAASASKTKLDGIATGATANATDAQLRDRSTHTGTQAAGTITGLGGAATLNVGTAAGTVCAGNDARLSDARTPTDGSVTTAKIVDANVTYAKIQNVSATDRLLGRSTAGAGVVEEITCSAFGRSLIDDADAAAARTTLGLAAVATSGSASDLSAGTLARARYAADLGTGSMTVSGSNSYGVSLDATARTLSQANALSIMGGSVGIGTLTPLSTAALELAGAPTTGQRELLRLRNTSTGNYFDISMPEAASFAGRPCFFVNGVLAFQILTGASPQILFASGSRYSNNAQIVGDSNANAYITMNNGAGTLQISSVNAMEFQKSYVAIGRWDTHGAFHVGANNTVAGATTNGGVLVAGAHARSRLHGQMVTSGGRFANTGDAQASTYHLRASTTDATATTLFLEGSSARLTIPAQSTWSFIARIAAYNSTDNEGAAWVVRGAIRRNNAGGTALLGTLQTDSFADTNMATAAIAVTADDTNEALQINVTGIASKTIRWHAVVETSEVSAGAAT